MHHFFSYLLSYSLTLFPSLQLLTLFLPGLLIGSRSDPPKASLPPDLGSSISLAGASFGNKRTSAGRPCTFALDRSISRHARHLEAGTCRITVFTFASNCFATLNPLIHHSFWRAASWYRPASSTAHPKSSILPGGRNALRKGIIAIVSSPLCDTAQRQCIPKTTRQQWRPRRSQRHLCCPMQRNRVFHRMRKSHCSRSTIVSSSPLCSPKTRLCWLGALPCDPCCWRCRAWANRTTSQIFPHLCTGGLDS